MKLKSLDPIIAVGVVISVALSTILVVIGQDSVISLLIGLVLAILTLLIDLIARLKESEIRVIKAFALEATLVNNQQLSSTVCQIANDYSAVKRLGFEFFSERVDDLLLEFHDVVHKLSEGKMITDIHRSKFTFGRRGIETARESLKTVAYANPSWWRTSYAEGYIMACAEAVNERHVEFTRVWVQNHETLEQYRDILERQERDGVKVFCVLPDELPRHLLEDYLIVDDRVLVRLELTLEGHARAEYVSVDPVEVGGAINNFDLLLRYSHKASDFFDKFKKE